MALNGPNNDWLKQYVIPALVGAVASLATTIIGGSYNLAGQLVNLLFVQSDSNKAANSAARAVDLLQSSGLVTGFQKCENSDEDPASDFKIDPTDPSRKISSGKIEYYDSEGNKLKFKYGPAIVLTMVHFQSSSQVSGDDWYAIQRPNFYDKKEQAPMNEDMLKQGFNWKVIVPTSADVKACMFQWSASYLPRPSGQ